MRVHVHVDGDVDGTRPVAGLHTVHWYTTSKQSAADDAGPWCEAQQAQCAALPSGPRVAAPKGSRGGEFDAFNTEAAEIFRRHLAECLLCRNNDGGRFEAGWRPLQTGDILLQVGQTGWRPS